LMRAVALSRRAAFPQVKPSASELPVVDPQWYPAPARRAATNPPTGPAPTMRNLDGFSRRPGAVRTCGVHGRTAHAEDHSAPRLTRAGYRASICPYNCCAVLVCSAIWSKSRMHARVSSMI
jgi:hypothetical protein